MWFDSILNDVEKDGGNEEQQSEEAEVEKDDHIRKTHLKNETDFLHNCNRYLIPRTLIIIYGYRMVVDISNFWIFVDVKWVTRFLEKKNVGKVQDIFNRFMCMP